MRPSVYAVATMDTKGDELIFLAEQLAAAGAAVTTVDVGTGSAPSRQPSVTRETVAACHPQGPDLVLGLGDRSAAGAAMAEALCEYLVRETAAGRVAGVIGIGGSGGTAIITKALQALPIGLPKLMLSTVASG